jgi:hypothetical protein
MADHGETLANFMAIADCSDDALAINTLEASDWKLEEAVNLFFASAAAAGGGNSGGGGASGYASGQQGGGGGGEEEEFVRAPIDSKIDRLVGGQFNPSTRAGPMYGLSGPSGSSSSRAQPAVDVFRDFEREGANRGGPANPNPGSNHSLSNLFAPPTGLLFQVQSKLSLLIEIVHTLRDEEVQTQVGSLAFSDPAGWF